MFEKNLSLGYLLDFYGEVLPEEQRELLSAYYYEDLSLSEAAELRQMTRQGARAAIKRGEKQLLFLEERLGLAVRHRETGIMAKRIEALSADISAISLKTGSAELAEAAHELDAAVKALLAAQQK